MPVKMITKERIERTMARTDHARLSEKDVSALKRLQAEIEASVAFLSECCDAVDSRIAHRARFITLADSELKAGAAAPERVVATARPTTAEARSRLVHVDTKPGG